MNQMENQTVKATRGIDFYHFEVQNRIRIPIIAPGRIVILMKVKSRIQIPIKLEPGFLSFRRSDPDLDTFYCQGPDKDNYEGQQPDLNPYLSQNRIGVSFKVRTGSESLLVSRAEYRSR